MKQVLDLTAENARRLALEEAAELAMTTAAAYRELQIRAREAGDTQGALAHLCEKDACIQLANEIRKLKEYRQTEAKDD